MIPAIEVHPSPSGYVWSVIANCGRVLVQAAEAFASDIDAFDAPSGGGPVGWRASITSTEANKP